MIGDFIGRTNDFPAVGISFGLEPITEAMKLAGGERRKTVVDVFIIPIKTPVESTALAQELRAAGINVDSDIMDRGISKNMDFANMLGIPFVIFVGKKELAEGQYKLKDMKTGDERMLAKEELIATLTRALVK